MVRGLYGDQLNLSSRKLSNMVPPKKRNIFLGDGEREREREREKEIVCKNMFIKFYCKYL